jgi:hypothetical protein
MSILPLKEKKFKLASKDFIVFLNWFFYLFINKLIVGDLVF